ncbi:MAG: hypothetical protein GEU99_22020 [Luteitalea sp.]|nr:hypothetical protein [Luteitalea sp.]
MNLSPGWVDRLAQQGVDAVHWSAIGAATAPDDDILSWAREHGFVLVTNDLDFSAILAATADRSPSVIQLRWQDLLSDAAIAAVVSVAQTHYEAIYRGALLSIDERRTRVRLLPLRERGGS